MRDANRRELSIVADKLIANICDICACNSSIYASCIYYIIYISMTQIKFRLKSYLILKTDGDNFCSIVCDIATIVSIYC